MKTYQKSHKLDNVCYDVRGPVLDEADRMAALGQSILKLNIGNPAPFGFRTSDGILREITENLPNAEGYCDSKGILPAREAIAGYARRKNIPNVGPDDVYTGNGVSEMILMSMQGLLDNGDEILVPSPDYPLWTAAVTLAGGKAVHYLCDESSDWNPDLRDMERKITVRTKGIVVINPNNPTGALYPRDLLEGIAELARRHGLILFADEIYDRLVMDGLEHISIASLAPDLPSVTLNGLSKSHKIAGYRVGWMCIGGNKERIRGYIDGLNMLSSMRLCSNVPAQYAIPSALAEYNGGAAEADETLLPGGRIYEQRAYITNALNDIPGISAVRPKAAFYIFPKIDADRFDIRNDERFMLDFLHEKRILMVHGGGFNWHRPDHFRIVYLPKIDALQYACENLRSFLETYRQSV